MQSTRRLLVLLGTYEDLTERETAALQRGDVDYAITLEGRKLRLAEAMAEARRDAVLSADDLAALKQRVRNLELREQNNLAFLREEMARIRVAISNLDQAAQRSRQVRRGYVGRSSTASAVAESILGHA